MVDTRDTAASVAVSPSATPGERYDAQSEVTKSALAEQLIPSAELAPVIDYINQSLSDAAFSKALSKGNIVPFPSKDRPDRGMQSVSLDEFGVSAQGQYWERPGLLGFGSMRSMVDSTPLLNSIILTRIRQVQRFCRPQMHESEAGFVIKHTDRNVELDDGQQQSVNLLQQFMMNCGWEANPRKRKRLKRDSFGQFMSKSVRDSLTMDASPIETEFKRDRSLGIDGFYAVDGATIRLCTEQGYEGDDEIFAVQVVQGRVRTPYTYDDLIYEVRNPRTDIMASGYGLSETEMLIRVVTYLLNTMTYNGSFFDKNSIPRGILHLSGNYDNNDIASFKRYWNAMVKGINNAHNLPLLVSKDQESKADFTEVGAQMNEMAFGKWMSFLTSVACAVYGISPEEISMESYTSGKSSLSGDDTEEKITSSNDKGLRPLLSYYENLFSDFIIQEFSDQYKFRFIGLDGDGAKERFEMRKLVMTWNEGRSEQGYDAVLGDLGDAPLNPALMTAWQAQQQAQQQAEQEDFGTPEDPGETPPQASTEPAPPPEQDFGEAPGGDGDAAPGQAVVTKAFGFPIYSIED